jgi:hypothetical protein
VTTRAKRIWSPYYIQQSAHIPANLLALIEILLRTPRYEPGIILPEKD